MNRSHTSAHPDWDLIVIGAGPAGSAAALHAAALNLRVLLVDKARFPRPKPCGCSLNTAAVRELERTGILAPADDAPPTAPFRSLHIHAFGTRLTSPLPGYLAADRALLDDALARRAAQLGVTFLPHTSAHLPNIADLGSPQPVHLHGSAPHTASAAIVILATGLAAPPAPHAALHHRRRRGSHIGLWATIAPTDHHHPPGRLLMAVASHGYVGAIRLHDGTLNIAAAIQPAALRAADEPARAILDIYRRAACEPPFSHDTAIRFRGTPPLTARPAQTAFNRILCVGDAAGYVEPFTGDGIATALATGRLAAQLAARTIAGDLPLTTLAPTWRRAHRRATAPRHRTTRLITTLLRRPTLTRATLALLGTAPAISDRLTRHTARPYHPPA